MKNKKPTFDDWARAMGLNMLVGHGETKYYRGVSKEEYRKIKKLGHALPSTDVMPRDGAILSHVIGDAYRDMSEEQIDEWIKGVCDWYDGSYQSVEGGVNLTTDSENATGYGDVVIEFSCDGEVADFGEGYVFARDHKDVKFVKVVL